MKIITVIGARPQFIKAAPFSDIFRREHQEILIHTGQHYDSNMSNIFFEELGIPTPDYNLEVGSGSHGQQTAKMLEKIEVIIKLEKPNALLVYGDTNSTLAGALAASKMHVPVYHVEAGLRSYNKLMPEEQNRILTDHISELLFCPTKTAVDNLKKEGIVFGVTNTGDIMYDAVLRNVQLLEQKDYRHLHQFQEKEYYLATIHRAENTDDLEKAKNIFSALEQLEKPVVLPVHPRTRRIIEKLDISLNNITIINPVGYLSMLHLILNSYMVITDSGGLQKEAYFLKTPCTTLRDQTEWVETLENQWNVLSKIDVNIIIKNAKRDLICFNYPQSQHFGDGQAARHIYEVISKYSGVSDDIL